MVVVGGWEVEGGGEGEGGRGEGGSFHGGHEVWEVFTLR